MGLKKAYLLAYNLALCAAWSYVLLLTARCLGPRGPGLPGLWAAVAAPLKVAQTAAVLEVAHAAAGLVRSPVGITAAQVASRLWVLWGVMAPAGGAALGAPLRLPAAARAALAAAGAPAAAARAGLSLGTLLAAWGATEVVRYAFLAAKTAAGAAPAPLTWARYSGFLVLYPLGVASEAAMVHLAAPRLRAARLLTWRLPNAWNLSFDYAAACYAVLVVAYGPVFPVLYGYMLAQRRKVLGGGARRPRAKTS